MIKLRVPFDEAKQLISAIPHQRAQSGSENNWNQGGRSGVTAQSICWLYCWAKTGLGSEKAAREAKSVFSQMFDRPYEWLDSRINHEWARSARYRIGDIEAEFYARLGA
jgi:hypothetical protein